MQKLISLHIFEIVKETETFGTRKYILHSLRYDVVDRHTSENVVDQGSVSVNKVFSGDNLPCHHVEKVIFI